MFFGILIPEAMSVHFLGSNTPIWPTDAVAVVALLRCGSATWPVLLLLQMFADTAVGIVFGDGTVSGFGGAVCDAVEITLVATALRHISRTEPLFASLGQISRFAAVCFLVPAVSACGGAYLLEMTLGLEFIAVWQIWYLSAAFGLLIVTPFLFMWTESPGRGRIFRSENLEVILLATLVGLVGWIDFGVDALPGLFLCFPFLLLSAFRQGLLGATTSACVLTVVATGLTLSGIGPIGSRPDNVAFNLLTLQAYLAVVLLSSLPVAVMLEQRKFLNAVQTHAELSRMARHDVLTGLPNRVLFQERLIWVQEQVRRSGGYTLFLLLDLDRFKPVNDLHGHAAGDRLLQLVADRLRATIRGTDTAARLGGDEFGIIGHIDEPESASILAGRLIEELGRPFAFSDLTVQIGCSVGIVFSPSDGADTESLATRADAALYRAKADGKNCFRFFEPGMDKAARSRAELEKELQQAVVNDEIVAYFQPVLALGSNRVAGFEMLARWTHPDLGEVSPSTFVPIAESIGLIGKITVSLLRQACGAARDWPDHLYVAMNVSPVQLRDRSLPATVRAILAESGFPSHRLEIELTETALIEDFELAREILLDFKSSGVRLALDDFGTGYSSLRHLQSLPLDKIKIDMDFIQSMASVTASRKIVAGVIGLGHSLGLPIVAEGIEDAATEETLKMMGCDLGQGWLYGSAVAAGEVHKALVRLARVEEAPSLTAAKHLRARADCEFGSSTGPVSLDRVQRDHSRAQQGDAAAALHSSLEQI